MNEILYNNTDTEREYQATTWMIYALNEALNDFNFYDLLIENLPSPLPRWKGNDQRWDWTNSKVSAKEFEKYYQDIRSIVQNKINGLENREIKLMRRMRDEKKATDKDWRNRQVDPSRTKSIWAKGEQE